MDLVLATVTRRFLQARRRGPLTDAEIARLVTEDARYTESVDGSSFELTGPKAIAGRFRRLWSGSPEDRRMTVIGHSAVDDCTVVATWRQEDGAGVIHGRDTYTVTEGRISRIEVEQVTAAVGTHTTA